MHIYTSLSLVDNELTYMDDVPSNKWDDDLHRKLQSENGGVKHRCPKFIPIPIGWLMNIGV